MSSTRALGGPAAARRELIVEAATRLFAEQGYGATSIEEIGQAAGITGAGVYSHFADKEAVLVEVLRRAADQTVARVPPLLDQAASPLEALELLVDNLILAATENRMALRVVLNESAHVITSPPFRAWYERLHRIHMAEWLYVLTQLRPELTEAELQVLGHSAFIAVLTAVSQTGASDEPRRAASVRQVMVSALLKA